MDSGLLNSLTLLDDKDSFDWALLGDPLPPVPPLLSETDALVPFPESLDQIDALHGLDPLSDNSTTALVPYQHHSPLSLSESDHILPPHYGCVISDVAPLNVVPSSINAVYDGKNNYSNPFEASQVSLIEERSIIERSTNGGRSRPSDIGFDEIKNYFCMPIARAAKEMNMGLTVLKKRCRELGIPRWPHRKMKSLKSLIHNVQELGKGASEESIKRELEILEKHRRLMEENPEIQLTERAKKLRQACFKANYKRRRALQDTSCCFDLRNQYYT